MKIYDMKWFVLVKPMFRGGNFSVFYILNVSFSIISYHLLDLLAWRYIRSNCPKSYLKSVIDIYQK